MTVTAQDVHSLASKLVTRTPVPKDECSQRTALSRAYYAAFHLVLGFMREKWKDPNYDPGHAALIGWLQSHDGQYLESVGDDLESLRARRSLADYELGSHFAVTDGGLAVNTVAAILRDSGRIRTEILGSRKPKPRDTSREHR